MYRYNRRKMRRRSTTLPEISLTPLIDTALTLLIIFMVTSPMINNAIKVELPRGKVNEDKGGQQELIVFLDRNDNLYFNNRRVKNNDELIKHIKDTVGGDVNRTVVVKADKGVHYGDVIELVDEIKIVGGVSYVALATQRA